MERNLEIYEYRTGASFRHVMSFYERKNIWRWFTLLNINVAISTGITSYSFKIIKYEEKNIHSLHNESIQQGTIDTVILKPGSLPFFSCN